MFILRECCISFCLTSYKRCDSLPNCEVVFIKRLYPIYYNVIPCLLGLNVGKTKKVNSSLPFFGEKREADKLVQNPFLYRLCPLSLIYYLHGLVLLRSTFCVMSPPACTTTQAQHMICKNAWQCTTPGMYPTPPNSPRGILKPPSLFVTKKKPLPTNAILKQALAEPTPLNIFDFQYLRTLRHCRGLR